jgi:hypothetical protein
MDLEFVNEAVSQSGNLKDKVDFPDVKPLTLKFSNGKTTYMMCENCHHNTIKSPSDKHIDQFVYCMHAYNDIVAKKKKSGKPNKRDQYNDLTEYVDTKMVSEK